VGRQEKQFRSPLVTLSIREGEDWEIAAPSGAARWQPSSLREILLRPTYAGSLVALASTAERVILPGVAEPIVTDEELAAVAARLERNKAHATRHNLHPERSLLRAGYIACGHCGWTLSVSNATPASRSVSPQYRCTAQRQHGPKCSRPSITASMIDPIVWDVVTRLLRRPWIIAREVARHRQDGGLDRQLAAVDKRLAALVSKHQQGTKRLLTIDDDTAETLSVELKALVEQRKAAEQERDDLLARIADQAQEAQRVRNLEECAKTVAANLDTLSYDEKRRTLDALGVRVRTYRAGTVDETGRPYPRWAITLEPTLPIPQSQSEILYRSTR
jgi:site-specific DNA recombinase